MKNTTQDEYLVAFYNANGHSRYLVEADDLLDALEEASNHKWWVGSSFVHVWCNADVVHTFYAHSRGGVHRSHRSEGLRAMTDIQPTEELPVRFVDGVPHCPGCEASLARVGSVSSTTQHDCSIEQGEFGVTLVQSLQTLDTQATCVQCGAVLAFADVCVLLEPC